MSTTFVICKKEPKLHSDGCIDIDSIDESDFVICARRTSGGMSWMNNFNVISMVLQEDTKVYPLDNTPQGIYTLKNIKDEVRKSKS